MIYDLETDRDTFLEVSEKAISQRAKVKFLVLEEKIPDKSIVEQIINNAILQFNLEFGTNRNFEYFSQRTRTRDIVDFKKCVGYLLKKHTRKSLSEIGKVFGYYDHSTVIHWIKSWQDIIDTEPQLKRLTKRIEAVL